jgi:hypothetical protein
MFLALDVMGVFDFLAACAGPASAHAIAIARRTLQAAA